MAFQGYPNIPGSKRVAEGALPNLPMQARQPFQPLSSGSQMRFEQPWRGQGEMAFSTFGNVMSRLPHDIGSMLIYKSAWDDQQAREQERQAREQERQRRMQAVQQQQLQQNESLLAPTAAYDARAVIRAKAEQAWAPVRAQAEKIKMRDAAWAPVRAAAPHNKEAQRQSALRKQGYTGVRRARLAWGGESPFSGI